MIQSCFHRRGGWVRIFGYGPFVCKDLQVLFSERYGYRKILRIGKWAFQWLTPPKKESA